MRSAPKLSLNLSFSSPHSPAHPEPPLSLNTSLGPTISNSLNGSSFRPLVSAVEWTSTSSSVMSLLPNTDYCTSPRSIDSSNNRAPSSPTSLNTMHNQRLASWCPSPTSALGFKTTTLTYKPAGYGPLSNSPKSILKRRDSDTDSIASTPPNSGRSIRFSDEPVIYTITPVSPTAQWGDGDGSGYVRMTKENRWQRRYDPDEDDDHGGVD